MLNNIVDIVEQCGQQNIVPCCFHQARTGCSFLLCIQNIFTVSGFENVDHCLRCMTWIASYYENGGHLRQLCVTLRKDVKNL